MMLQRNELERDEAKIKVMQWFFSFPNKAITLSELAEKTHISKATANRIVQKYREEGFVKVEELGRVWRIQCNKEHKWNHTRKIAHHFMELFEKNTITHLKTQYPNAITMILFGSYRYGEDTEQSDIDIAIEVQDTKELEIVHAATLKKIGYRTNVPVMVHVFNRKHTGINLFNNIANGIVLDGFLEVKP